MPKSIILLVKMIFFILNATAIYAVMHHYFAILVYNYKLREDWKYIMSDNDWGSLFIFPLVFYSIASGILYVIVLFAGATNANTRWLILVLITTTLITAAGFSVGRVADMLTMRALTETLIFLIPTFLIKYIVKGDFNMYHEPL